MFRDQAGRVRLEQSLPGQPSGRASHRAFVLAEPGRRIALLLDPATRTAKEVPSDLVDMAAVTRSRLVVPVSMRCVISFSRPQSIHQRQGGDSEETAPGLELRVRIEDEMLGVMEHEVTRLSLVEPSRSLFEIPPGYTQADAEYLPLPDGRIGREPYGWDNPYTLVTSRRDSAPCALASR